MHKPLVFKDKASGVELCVANHASLLGLRFGSAVFIYCFAPLGVQGCRLVLQNLGISGLDLNGFVPQIHQIQHRLCSQRGRLIAHLADQDTLLRILLADC